MNLQISQDENPLTLRAVRAMINVLLGEETTIIGNVQIVAPSAPVVSKKDESSPAPVIPSVPVAPVTAEGAVIPPPPAAPVVPPVDDVSGPLIPPKLDIEGLPWDERIHASTAMQTKGGTWTRKRGVEDAYVTSIVVELRKSFPIPTTVAPTLPNIPANGPITPPVAPPLAPPVSEAPAVPPVAAPAVPTAPPPPPATPAGGTVTWPQICAAMNEKLGNKKTTPEGLNEIAKKHGLTGPFALIATRPDLWVAVYSDVMAIP